LSATPVNAEPPAHIEILCAVLREQFPDKVGSLPLSPETRLRDEISLDSLDLLTLAAVIENHYGRAVLDEQTNPNVFATVGSFSRHLAALSTERVDS